MSALAVVFRDPDQPYTKASTLLYQVEGRPDPAELTREKGTHIAAFFKALGVSVEEYMRLFPGKVVFAPRKLPDPSWVERFLALLGREPSRPKLSWDGELRWQRLPTEEDELRRLSKLIGMPIYVFSFYRSTDVFPHFEFEVSPA